MNLFIEMFSPEMYTPETTTSIEQDRIKTNGFQTRSRYEKRRG
jgi:hypothetical protein